MAKYAYRIPNGTAYGLGGKGTNQRIAINSLKMLYLMCLQYRDGGSYNGYLIDDILIDKYNFDKYISSGITGNRLIAHFGNMTRILIAFL